MVLQRGFFDFLNIYLAPLEKPKKNYEKTAKNGILIVNAN